MPGIRHKEVRTSVIVDTELFHAMRKAAKDRNQSVSELVRCAVMNMLEMCPTCRTRLDSHKHKHAA